MFIIKKKLSSLIATAAFVVTNNNTANAAALRRVTENSAESRDVEAEVSINSKNDIDRSVPNESIETALDGIISMIEPDVLDEVIPNSASILGCVRANNNAELESLITAAGEGGEVRLCPGIVDFNEQIMLTDSITIACAGPKYSCIFDGKGVTRHLSNTFDSSSAYAFSGIAFINGFWDESQMGFGAAGSVNFARGSSLFDRCLFYNNRVVFSSGSGSSAAGGAIFAFGGTTVVNNCVFLGNTATSESSTAEGGAIHVRDENLSVLDSTFTKNEALQDDPSAVNGLGETGGGGAIYIYAVFGDINFLVAGSVFELNKASVEGGAVHINDDEINGGEVKVGWINNNELLFGNTANEGCGGIFDFTSKTCDRVGDNFSV